MASRSDTELLTEHFGYAPVSLLDEIINSVNFLAERALHSIEQGLLNAPPASLGFRSSRSARSRNQDHDRDDRGHGNDRENEDESGEDAAARRHRDEIESGTHQLETLLWASIDRNFDVFEIYVMRNILCLRPVEMEWLRLGHYEGLDFGWLPRGGGAGGDGGGKGRGGEEEEEEEEEKKAEQGEVWSLAKEVEETDVLAETDGADDDGGDGEAQRLTVGGVNRLRRRLQASQRLNCMLVAERARNAALLGEMRRLVGVLPGQAVKTEPAAGGEAGAEGENQRPPLGFLHDKGDLTEGDAETPLTTTTAFSLTQLQALRELSTALRGLMANLAAGGGDEDEAAESGKKSWRRERMEYVETATRKHLENVRGLELGKNGEVRDGEWDGGGRSLARGEVESLEKVIGMLGGTTDTQDRMDES